MAKVIFGNHSSVIVPRKDRDSIRNSIATSSAAKSQKRSMTGTSIAWAITSISGFFMEMLLMKASSYELRDRSGWKLSQTT
jgi:hypothetical protein